MLTRIRRLFTIKTRFEAFAVIYALALGAADRGIIYMAQYPGVGGKLLFLACTGAVFMAGAKILDCLRHEKAAREAALAPAEYGFSGKRKVGVSVASYPRSPGIRFCCPVGPTAL